MTKKTDFVVVGEYPFKPRSKEEIHKYWLNPDEFNDIKRCLPSDLMNKRTDLLVKTFEELHIPKESSVLEIGCNVGRNLYGLYSKNYKNLYGADINKNALKEMKKHFPDMGKNIKTFGGPIEETIKCLDSYDVIYTVLTFEHIHTDSEWIFKEVAKKVKNILILIEDEKTISWRHFYRNYKEVFESLGLKQIKEKQCSIENGLDSRYILRVFKKV